MTKTGEYVMLKDQNRRAERVSMTNLNLDWTYETGKGDLPC